MAAIEKAVESVKLAKPPPPPSRDTRISHVNAECDRGWLR